MTNSNSTQDRKELPLQDSGYTAQISVKVSAERAWEALGSMADWLPTLSTIQSVEPEPGHPGEPIPLVTGQRYLTRTGEGPVMRCHIVEADREQGLARIEARLGPLHSVLRCSVKSTGSDSCILERQQSYPGLVGKIFTLFFGRREASETNAYLQAWADYALG